MKIPNHVGIIMDGNRRWAKERNLKPIQGHEKGFGLIRECPDWFFRTGVKIVSLYAFPAENWNRAQEEVNYLMSLFRNVLIEGFEYFNEKGIRLLVSGRIAELPGDLPAVVAEAEANTKFNKQGTLQICVNYGGRLEILDMIKKVLEKKLTEEQIHEGIIRKYLYHGELPDPDIIVRTAGEKKLSGFLAWQSVDSELIFMEKYWPDFEKSDVEAVLQEYGRRVA